MINLNLTNDRICGTFIKVEGGKQTTEHFDVAYTEDLYKEMKNVYDGIQIASSMEEVKKLLNQFENLAKEDQNDVLYSITDKLYRDTRTGLCYLKMGDVVSSIAMPRTLSNWIFEIIQIKVS